MKDFELTYQELSGIHKKLTGLGELFDMSRGEVPMTHLGYMGIALILTGLAVEIENIADFIRPDNNKSSQ